MPVIPILPAQGHTGNTDNPLPNVLRTPSGLALLEIQGTVNFTQQQQPGSSLEIGDLQFPLYDPASSTSDVSWQKRVHLYVGKHQRLTGEVKKLPQPIALLRRASTESAEGGEDQALEIAEVIHYKLLFTHRPEPVGTKTEQ